MTATPVHLSGAKCGDRVLFCGEELGVIHCWAEGGACVRLNKEYLEKRHHPAIRLGCERLGAIVAVSHVFVSDEQFAVSDYFTIVPF